jgi:hypothetical protein
MIRLLDSEWERIREHFPEENIPDGRPGRKPIPTRLVLEAVLWILNTGAQWHMLPQCYPNYKTVHRRFQTWCRNEIPRQVLTDIANELRERGALDEEECFIDATFAMAKGGAISARLLSLLAVAHRSRHKGPNFSKPAAASGAASAIWPYRSRTGPVASRAPDVNVEPLR